MKNKTKVILLVSGILILIVAIIIVIIKQNQEKPELNNDIKISEERFFTIREAVNTYLMYVNSDNINELFNCLDKQYVYENGIDASNVSTKLDANYVMPSFVANKILQKNKDDLEFYFVNGYVIDYSIGENVTYDLNLNYLVIVRKDIFNVRPLQSNGNIENYFNYLNIDSIKVNNGVALPQISYSEKSKISSYIAEFTTLLRIDSNRAFNLLENKPSYNEFVNNINMYNLSTVISSYKKEKTDNYTKYEVIDNNNRKFTIIEYDIMNYKINI